MMASSLRRYFFLLLLLSASLSAQNIHVRNFTTDDGLPSNTVRAIFKDSRRIMWIGTSAGLCRFNGRDFIVFNSQNGLKADNIFELTEDDDGNLWIASMGSGISKYDGLKFTNFTTKDGLVCNEVRRVWWSKKFHCLVIGTNKGVSVYDGTKFYSLSADKVRPLSGELVMISFTERSNWIDLDVYGLSIAFRYYPSIRRFGEIPSTGYRYNNPSCSPAVMEGGDTVHAWGRQGIRVINGKEKMSFDSLGQVFHMYLQDKTNLWVAAWAETPSSPGMPGGLYHFDGQKVTRMSERFGITDASVWTVFYDSVFHTLFVGTLHQGLFRVPSPVFEWYDARFFGLRSMNISDILITPGNTLWMTTSREVIRYPISGKPGVHPLKMIRDAQRRMHNRYKDLQFGYFNEPDGSFEKYDSLRRKGKYPFPNPYNRPATQFGKVIPCSKGRFYRPDEYRRSVNQWSRILKDTSAVFFHALAFDSKRNVYASTGEGLFRFNSDDSEAEAIPVFANLWTMAFDSHDTLFYSSSWDKGMAHVNVNPSVYFPEKYFVTADEGGAENPVRTLARGDEIWSVSRVAGLFMNENGRYYAFCKQDSTLPLSMNDLCFDGPENVIIGCNNGEIIIGKKTGDRFSIIRRISAKDGIAGNSIKWVCIDHHRMLYAGTNRGLNIINLDLLNQTGHLDLSFYSKESGFNLLNVNRAVCDQEGDIWLAANHELCRIHTDLIRMNPAHKFRLVFTGLEVNNSKVISNGKIKLNPWFGSPLGAIRLSHNQNNLVFYFQALNYLAPEQVLFRYRLLPALKKWTEYSNETKAVFTTLDPGNYVLEVESVNPMNHNQVTMLTQAFRISPPFYLTWWFILAGILLAGGLLYTFYMIRTRAIRRQEKEKAEIRVELNNLEMKALKAQMNPHFIFNAINSIQSYILSRDTDKALYYLGLFAKLVRRTLENATQEAIPLCEEIDYLRYYIELEKMRFEDVFDCEIIIDPALSCETTMIPPMIVQPFIENAIKHGLLRKHEKGILKLEVRIRSAQQVEFIIEDDGIGRKKAEEIKSGERPHHKSKGMEMTLKRIEVLNENGSAGLYGVEIVDLHDDAGNAAGTRVVLVFPREG